MIHIITPFINVFALALLMWTNFQLHKSVKKAQELIIKQDKFISQLCKELSTKIDMNECLEIIKEWGKE